MLLNFKTKNYKSFVEEMDFSMTPAPKQKGLDYSILSMSVDGKTYKGLSTAVIYGPNASGKTNVIGAMDTFRSIVLRGSIQNTDITSPNTAAAKLELVPNCKEIQMPTEFSILFVDHERLVVGMETQSCTFFANEEYGIKLSFSIKRGPILTRDIFVTSIVNKIYRSGDGLYSCVDFRYTTLQEEDLRFLYEKATSTLFN